VHGLENRHLDIALLRPPRDARALAYDVVRREPLVLAVPANHALADADLGRHLRAPELVLILPHRALDQDIHDMVLGVFQRLAVRVHVAAEATTIREMLSFVSAGLGVALVPETVEPRDPGVIIKRLIDPPIVEMAVARLATAPNPLVTAFLNSIAHVSGEPSVSVKPVPTPLPVSGVSEVSLGGFDRRRLRR
jgi:DNA-binding transcriptional LysR family regulator